MQQFNAYLPRKKVTKLLFNALMPGMAICKKKNAFHTIQDVFFQTEYKYCYDLVLHYVLHYLNKDTEEQQQ